MQLSLETCKRIQYWLKNTNWPKYEFTDSDFEPSARTKYFQKEINDALDFLTSGDNTIFTASNEDEVEMSVPRTSAEKVVRNVVRNFDALSDAMQLC